MKNFTTKNTLKYLFALYILSPVYSYAATATSDTVFGGLGNIINSFNESVVKSVGTLFLTTAVVVFFYGIVKFILSKSHGDAGGVKLGQSFMAWGLLALFVMFSVWGIISFFGKSLGIDTGGTIKVPSLKFDTGTGSNSSSNGGGSLLSNPGNGGSSSNGPTAQQAYDTCISNANSPSVCLTAYKAWGGTGTPVGYSGGGSSTAGCVSEGNSCSFGGGAGVCARNESGELYCRQ